MSEYRIASQLGVIKEAKELMEEAQRQSKKKITFEQALEIIKIQRLGEIGLRISTLTGVRYPF